MTASARGLLISYGDADTGIAGLQPLADDALRRVDAREALEPGDER